MKINMICFDGVDRSGKDTVRVKCDRMFDYSLINVVRGPIGYVTYNRQFNKGQDEEAFIETARVLDGVMITIYLRNSVETLEERCRATNEVLRDGRSISEQKELYESVVAEATTKWGLENVHVVDNDGPIEDTMARIADIVRKYGYSPRPIK